MSKNIPTYCFHYMLTVMSTHKCICTKLMYVFGFLAFNKMSNFKRVEPTTYVLVRKRLKLMILQLNGSFLCPLQYYDFSFLSLTTRIYISFVGNECSSNWAIRFSVGWAEHDTVVVRAVLCISFVFVSDKLRILFYPKQDYGDRYVYEQARNSLMQVPITC